MLDERRSARLDFSPLAEECKDLHSFGVGGRGHRQQAARTFPLLANGWRYDQVDISSPRVQYCEP